jgi:hypothetical protein
MRNKKYYAILQEKFKNAQGETIIKEYVHDVEGFAPMIARSEAEAYAKESGMTVSLFCAYK